MQKIFLLCLMLAGSLFSKELSEIMVQVGDTKIPASEIQYKAKTTVFGFKTAASISELFPDISKEVVYVDFIGIDADGKLAKENKVTKSLKRTTNVKEATLKTNIHLIAYDFSPIKPMLNRMFSKDDQWVEFTDNNVSGGSLSSNVDSARSLMTATSAAGGSNAAALGLAGLLLAGKNSPYVQLLYQIDFQFKNGQKQTSFVKFEKHKAHILDQELYNCFIPENVKPL